MKFIIENESITADLSFGPLPVSPNKKIGYQPYELFISSLIGCSGALLGTILKKKRYSYETIEMEVSSVRNSEHANRFEQISIHAYIQSDQPLNEENAKKIAHLVINNCGMIQSIMTSVDISFHIHSANSASR
ncbi:OsmC family protein [Metabacillus fastidiosus]|uniref:OsmC family protein n=1 Tax=Metabacillus fastidiosus TaxID=1458 RepID=UPI002E1A3DD0|nr:OsmC family protein [Metabacillus fastidiosus]